MTEYDLNKQVYKSLPQMTEQAILIARNMLGESLEKQPGPWYMLLSRDGRDYTVFKNSSHNIAALIQEIFDLLNSRGKLKGIDIEDDYMDFWIESNIDEEVQLYKLFPYNWGIIEV